MRGSDSGSGKHAPFRIKPELGQVSENVSDTPGKQPWDVLQEHEARSHVTNDARDVGPHPPLIGGSGASASDAPRLAREARRDDVHASTPRCAVEGCEIVPDRRAIHGRILHPRHESGRSKGFPLNVTHAAIGVSEGESEPEFQSADTGT